MGFVLLMWRYTLCPAARDRQPGEAPIRPADGPVAHVDRRGSCRRLPGHFIFAPEGSVEQQQVALAQIAHRGGIERRHAGGATTDPPVAESTKR